MQLKDRDIEGASDEALVEIFLAGDKAAFGELYRRYSERLSTYAARLVNNDDLGCDIAQGAFLKAFKTLPSLQDPKVCFKSWLYKIATNLVRDHWKRERIIRWFPLMGNADRIGVEGPEQQQEEADLIRRALGRVSPKYRECLLLDVVAEMPQYEITAVVHKSERSVRRYIYKGKEELRKAYNHITRTYK